MSDAPKNLVRTTQLSPEDAMRVRHPLNPNAEIFVQPLSTMAGMQRAHLSLARLPPCRESFMPHSHSVQEEFLFILEGEGLATIGAEEVRVGPGDYLGFPTDGTVHHMTNVGDADLVYLMGGERTEVEVSRFPTIGKTLVMKGETIQIFDEGTAEVRHVGDWIAEKE